MRARVRPDSNPRKRPHGDCVESAAQTAGYLQANSKALDNLKNGLTDADNRKLTEEQDVDVLVNRVVEQLSRLLLVRGQPLGRTTFRILALDGGDIKGTFTPAVLAKWEELTQLRLADPGTSTGGILALGLGMGAAAKDILKFYVDRGPTVFR